MNISQLLIDAELHGAGVYDLGQAKDGSLRFKIFFGDAHIDIWMPDLPLREVRYLRGDKTPAQEALIPPRVEIDGNRWTWPVAIDVVSRRLLGSRRDEETLRSSVIERKRRSAEWHQIVAQLGDLGAGESA